MWQWWEKSDWTGYKELGMQIILIYNGAPASLTAYMCFDNLKWYIKLVRLLKC